MPNLDKISTDLYTANKKARMLLEAEKQPGSSDPRYPRLGPTWVFGRGVAAGVAVVAVWRFTLGDIEDGRLATVRVKAFNTGLKDVYASIIILFNEPAEYGSGN